MMATAPNNAQQKPNPTPGKTHTGTVTKLLDNFGFIDDSIFFPLSAIKGVNVKIGDKVYYECTYTKNLPFNWNATLVQLVPPNSAHTGPGPVSSGGGMSQPHQSPSPGVHQQPPAQQQQPYSMAHPQQQQQQPPQHPTGYNPYQQPPSNNSSAGPPPHQQSANNYYQAKGPGQQQPPPHMPPYQPAPYQQYGGGPPTGPPQQQQGHPPPPGSGPSPRPQAPPFPDLAKVQQAVALAQQYFPQPGAPGGPQQPGGPPQAGGPPGPGGPPPGAGPGQQNQGPRGPGPGQYGQIMYTSTPGSAFSSTPQPYPPQQGGPPKQQQQLPPGPPGPLNRGPPPPGGPPPGPPGGRWGPGPGEPDRYDPRRAGGPPPPMGGPRDNGPPQGRFDGPPPGAGRGGKSRFDNNDRFGAPIPIPPPPPPPQQQAQQQMPPDDHSRFGPPPSQQQQQPPSDMFRNAGPGRDEFGRDLRNKDEPTRFGGGPPPAPIGNRDKDQRENFRDRNDSRDRDITDRDKDDSSVPVRRDNDKHGGGGRNDRRRGGDRDRGGRGGRDRDRDGGADRDNRDKNRDKRSISPASVASSSGGVRDRGDGRNQPSSGMKRRYEPCNIPKNMILRNRYSPNEIKTRISSTVHIPSDLKEVLFNVDADLDLLDIPKPLVYTILNNAETSSKPTSKSKDRSESKDKDKDKEKKDSKKENEKKEEKALPPVATPAKPLLNETIDKTPAKLLIDESFKSDGDVSMKEGDIVTESKEVAVQDTSVELNQEPKSSDEPAPEPEPAATEQPKPDATIELADMEIDEESMTEGTSAPLIETNVPLEDVGKSQEASVVTPAQTDKSSVSQETISTPTTTKSSHRFNVKVLLISLPTLAEIYEKIFGSDFDNISNSASSSGKNRVAHFNKLFSMLVYRNSDNGYSLVGGKWLPEKDGTLAGSETPNLIATAIRVVQEQTGLNLSSCKQWKVFSTFIYNMDNELDSSSSSYEITKIYFPDIWSALDTAYAPLDGKEVKPIEEKPLETDSEMVKPASLEKSSISEPTVPKAESTEESTNIVDCCNVDSQMTEVVSSSSAPEKVDVTDEPEDRPTKEYLEDILENINDMKVADLRSELEKLNQKVDGRPRKDQLAQKLRDYVNEQLEAIVNVETNKEEAVETSENENAENESTQNVELQNGLPDSQEIDQEMQSETESQQVDIQLEPSGDEPQKRKLDTENTQPENETKKLKIEEPKAKAETKTEEVTSLVATGSNSKVKGHHLSVVTLYGALNPHRNDQFELSVCAELLRDSLVVHFSRYILSALIHNYHALKTLSASAASTTTSVLGEKRVVPVNYVHLAFSYFDKGHCGSVPADDISCLLNSTGFPISRKVFTALTTANGGDRLLYRDYESPEKLADRTVDYPSISTPSSSATATIAGAAGQGPLIVEHDSVQYNLDELIRQSKADSKLKVRLNEELVSSQTQIGQLELHIGELEAKQKKMSAATGRQNDELCAVKRERDQLKTKFEQLRKTLEKTQTFVTEALKQSAPLATVLINNVDTNQSSQPDVASSS